MHMIKLLDGFPDNVVAFAYHGDVTKPDYDAVLIPDLEDRLRRHRKIRIYVEIAKDLDSFEPLAVWADQKVGFRHFFDWDRCAVVTDVAWAQHIAKASAVLGFLWPGQYRAFSKADVDQARQWISADS
jgi:hypothetical protein